MFYDRYIELCEKNNKKPYAVAKELGLSNSNVAQWKKGSTPRKEVVQRIAEYFNVSVAYLLTGEEQKEKPPGEGELSKEEKEIIDLYNRASPELRAAALAMLKAAEAARKVPGEDEGDA